MSIERFTLTQEHVDMLNNRSALDERFEAFMAASLTDRRGIREELSKNTRTIGEIHVALFAQDEHNEFGMTGLVTNMQRVVRHTEVVCNLARFCKWAVVGALSMLAPALAALHYLGWI